MVVVLKEEGIFFEINGYFENFLLYVLNLLFLKINVELMFVNLDLVGIVVLSGLVCIVGVIDFFYVFVVMFGKGFECLIIFI